MAYCHLSFRYRCRCCVVVLLWGLFSHVFTVFFWGCWAANQNPWCVSWHSAGYVQCLPCFWERDLAGSSCGLQMWWCPCWARLKLNLGSRIFFFLHSTTVQPWYSSSVSMQAWYSFIDFLIWCNIFLQNLCVNMLIGPSKHHHASEATCPDVSYLRQIWSIRLV